MVPVIILCGGLGTRLHEVLPDRPKVLAPVAGRPFLDYMFVNLSAQGFRDIILSTGHMADQITDYAGHGDRWQVDIRYTRESEPLGTGGAIRFAIEKHNIQTPFIALNGDTIFTGSLDRLVSFHRSRKNAKASLALVLVKNTGRYGTIRFDPETGAVTRFAEKRDGEGGVAWINAGVYVLEPDLFIYSTKEKASLELDLFPNVVGKGLYGCPFPEAAFMDIGIPEAYARAEALLNKPTANSGENND